VRLDLCPREGNRFSSCCALRRLASPVSAGLAAYLNSMLSQVILKEIFTVKYRVSEQALDHISDELDQFRCVVSRIEDNDLAVTIYFFRNMNGLPAVNGEIRIDRITRNFQIVGTCEGLMLPVEGDWSVILEYLRQLTCPS